MPSFNARVTVTLKNGVLDPQGKAIKHALGSLDFSGIDSVRQGKIFEIEIDAVSKSAAEETVKAISDKLLANTVIEDYTVDIT